MKRTDLRNLSVVFAFLTVGFGVPGLLGWDVGIYLSWIAAMVTALVLRAASDGRP